jgi:predicted Fe-S protein YdhL (DUF1289 family)
MDDASGLCLGCYRTLAEVATWSRLSEIQRASVMSGLNARRALISPEKLGPA